MIKPLPNPPWRLLDFSIAVAIVAYLVFWGWLAHNDLVPGRDFYWLFVPPVMGVVTLICMRAAAQSTNGRIRNFLVFRSRYKVFDDNHPTYRLVDFLRAAE